MLFVVDLFSAGGAIVKVLIFGIILYFISKLGMVYVNIFIILSIGLFFIYAGFSVGSPSFMLFSSCVTFEIIAALLIKEYYHYNLFGVWHFFGRGGLVVFGSSLVMTYFLRRLNTFPWRFFVALSKIHEDVDADIARRQLRREGFF